MKAKAMPSAIVASMLLLYALFSAAQTVQPILQPRQTFVDASGLPCAGCSLYSYVAGTTTPLATYTDSTGGSQNTNPIILDASGGAQIWLGGKSYKFVLKNALGTTIWTVDNVMAFVTGNFFPSIGGRYASQATVEGQFQANEWQSPVNTGNNGITMSLAQCASLPYACQILAPALYATVEQQPWGGSMQWTGGVGQGPTAADVPGCVTDQRFGLQILCIPSPAPNWSQINGYQRFQMGPSFTVMGTALDTAFSSSPSPGLSVNKFMFHGTHNYTATIPNGGAQTNNYGLLLDHYVFSPASNYGLFNYIIKNSPGDGVPVLSLVLDEGGISAGDNEGNTHKFTVEEGGDVYGGTLNTITAQSGGTSPCTGPCYVLGTTQTQGGKGTTGEERPLTDFSKGDSNGYISAVGSAQVTIAGNDFDATYGDSTAWGTTTQAITNPGSSVNTFPQPNVTVSITTTHGSWNTTQPVCIFDASGTAWECQKVTAASSGSLTFAVVQDAHGSGAFVAQGGMTGMGFTAKNDWVGPGINSGFGIGAYGISNVVRPTSPILYNETGGVLHLVSGYRVGFSAATTRAYSVMAGSGGSCTATLSGGAIASCSCSGGTGYLTPNDPPQLSITGLTGANQPTIFVSGIVGGSLTSCSVATPGSGLTGSPTVTVTTANPYAVYPMARTVNVWNPATGAVDGSSIATDQLMPAASFWATGDTVEMQHGYAGEYTTQNAQMFSFQPIHPSNYGRGVTIGGPFHTNDFADAIYNTNDIRLYSGLPSGVATPWRPGYGQTGTPNGYTLAGGFRYGLAMYLPAYGAGSAVGGLFIGCSDTLGSLGNLCPQWNQESQVITHQNANLVGSTPAEDIFGFNPVTMCWELTSGATGFAGFGAASVTTFCPSGMTATNATISTSGLLTSGLGENFAQNSSDLTAGSWGIGSGSPSLSRVSDSLYGTVTQITATGGMAVADTVGGGTDLTAGANYTIKALMKGAVGGELVGIYFDNSVAVPNQTLTTGWQSYCFAGKASNPLTNHWQAVVGYPTGVPSQTIQVANVTTAAGTTCGIDVTTPFNGSAQLTTPTAINQINGQNIATVASAVVVQAVTFSVPGAMGSGATVVCASGAHCSTAGGTVTATTGTTSTAVQFGLNTTPALPNSFNCTANVTLPALALAGVTSQTTTAATVNTGAIAVDATAYTVNYTCNQN